MEGHCLCGAVCLHVKSDDKRVSVCHCSMCRRQNAGPLYFLDKTFRAGDFELTGPLGTYQSSSRVRRGFCQTCGSVIYWKRDEDFSFNAALFDGTGFELVKTYHLEDGASYEV